MGHPGLTHPRWTHYTEEDTRVLTYLHNAFGVEPIKQIEGADLLCGDVRIEVKACREWIATRPENNRGAFRRRGRFKFHGTENADFILFVLETGDELLMTMLDAETFFQEYGHGVRTVVWPLIFPLPPPGEQSSFRPLQPMIACSAS